MSQDESRVRELQTALSTKMADNTAIADSFKIQDGTVVVSTDQKSAFDKNMRDIKEIKSLIEGLNSMKEVESWNNAPQGDSVASLAAAFRGGDYGSKSLGQAFLESPEFKALAGGRNGANMPSPFVMKRGNIGDMGRKDLYQTAPNDLSGARVGINNFGATERDAFVIPPMRTRRVRDLFPSRTTTAAVVEYFRMIGFVQNGSANTAASTTNPWGNAAGVPERLGDAYGLKPQSSIGFSGQQAPIRTIAHWEAAHRNVLADEPQLRAIIDNELLYGLRLQEDDQILNGNGTGENLQGILSTTGIQNYLYSASANGQGGSAGGLAPYDNRADAIRRAATLAMLAYYEPTGVIVHPSDWEKMELLKDANGQYLVAVSVAMGGDQRIWRMPVIDTPAITKGTALVGAFGTGAQLYDREEANIRISEQHSDFFVRNAIVILAEQRLALAVKRPESFVKISGL